MKTHQPCLTLKRACVVLAGVTAILLIAGSLAHSAPQPVLKIAQVGSNQFSIIITNGVSTTNYTLFWTPALADANHPWQVVDVGEVGETNFTVDVGGWQAGFLK